MLILVEPLDAPDHAERGHPERPERITAARAGVDDLRLGSDLHIVPSDVAPLDDLARVHSPAHLARLEETSTTGFGRLDPDTFFGPSSWDAARRSAGAALAAVEASSRFGAPAFVAARPPGHHATVSTAMGFCLINNVAVAAAALAAQGERVLVLDWDVHHGNGTQDIFWDDPQVLYVSLHQWPCYPGTGAAEEIGGPRARGLTCNVPLPPGSGHRAYRAALDQIVGPVATAFDPTWVLVSAGFDAHRDDPLASMSLTDTDFGDMAAFAADLAPSPGRLVLLLEGGYSLDALRSSVTACLGRLVGLPTMVAPQGTDQGTDQASADHEVSDIVKRRRHALESAD